MNLQESGEMYLETILVLSKRNKDVRSIDIAHELNYSKPSVSRAIGLLKKDEYVIVDSEGYIELTDKGLKVATTIYDRHDTLSSFFESIGVSHDTAVNDACRIEHVISDETMNKIKEHMKNSSASYFLLYKQKKVSNLTKLCFT